MVSNCCTPVSLRTYFEFRLDCCFFQAKGHCEESEVVVQLPDTLCLCLTRFANVEVGYKVDKNNRPLAKVIKMTNKVDISDAADPDGFDLGILLGGASRLYKLFAVLAHRGSSRTSGTAAVFAEKTIALLSLCLWLL